MAAFSTRFTRREVNDMSRWTSIKRKAERLQDTYAAVAFAEAGELEKARQMDQERRASVTDGKETLRREILSRRTDRPRLR
jgi:hypothetical protein